MTLLKPRCSVLCLFLFLVSRVGSLAIEYLTIGNGPASYLEFPLVWLVPSLGLIFPMFDMFRGLRAYYVMSERLQCRLRWRDWSVFKRFLLTIITLSAILAARDMCLRWVKFHRKWTGDYPWYSCFAFLYIAFILLQGIYLIAVTLCMDSKMVTKYLRKEGVQDCVESLLIINFIFLVYDMVWTFTLIQKEGMNYFLYSDVFTLEIIGVLLFHTLSIILWIFLLKHNVEPEATTELQLPDQRTEYFLYIFRWVCLIFSALSVLRWSILSYNWLEDSSTLLVLFLAFLVVGIICVGCKIWLVWEFIVDPNFKSPVSNEYKVKHWLRASLLFLTMICSLVVIVHLGKDSYDLRHPLQQAALYQFFLSVYVVAHLLLVLFEGVVIMWQLLFEDIIQYHGQYAAQARYVAKEVLWKCFEASGVFSAYSVLFVFGLPEFGLNFFTLLRLLAGPSFFHLVVAFAYYRLYKNCLTQPEQQQQQEVQCHGSQANASASASYVQKDQWHDKTTSLVDRFPSRSLVLAYSFLLLLSVVRWLLVSETMGPTTLWQTYITYVIWLAYTSVCVHWLYVMIYHLSCYIVIKRSFLRIGQIVKECSVLDYPTSVVLGICFLITVVLAIVSEAMRYNLSTTKWGYNDWSSLLGFPLVVVHAIVLTCQGLLLSGAVIASDTAKETKEEENVPCFDDSLGYLLAINAFLLVEHGLFVYYTHTDLFEILAVGLILYHGASCCVIVFLWQTQSKETAVPSDAKCNTRNESKALFNLLWMIPEPVLSPCFSVYNLITSDPLQGTIIFVRIMVVLDICIILAKLLLPPTEYKNCLTLFHLFTSVAYAVANYYVWKFLTSPAAHSNVPAERSWSNIIMCSMFTAIAFTGVAEIGFAVFYQMVFPFNGSLTLNISLLTVGFMNVAFVLQEGCALILLVIWKGEIGKSHRKSNIIQLMLTVNLYYVAFGVFNSFLVWSDKYSPLLEFNSIMGLLGHLTCSVLLPAMLIPVLVMMREDVNEDSRTQAVAESTRM